MKSCPSCGSERYPGSDKTGHRCLNCGYLFIPEEIRIALSHKPVNDGGIMDLTNSAISIIKPSLTIINSPLFDAVHDLHNNAYKFRILQDNPDLDLPRQPGFKGRLFCFEFNGCKIKKSSKWLIIYKDGRNKVPLRSLYNTSDMILKGLAETAQEIARRYGFKIDPTPLSLSSNRPEVKTGFLSADNFQEPEAQAVYSKPGEPGPIELKGPNAVRNSFLLSESLAQLADLTALEIQNKQLHQAVLCEIRDAIRELKDHYPRPQGLIERIKNMLGFWLSKPNNKTMTDINHQ